MLSHIKIAFLPKCDVQFVPSFYSIDGVTDSSDHDYSAFFSSFNCPSNLSSFSSFDSLSSSNFSRFRSSSSSYSCHPSSPSFFLHINYYVNVIDDSCHGSLNFTTISTSICVISKINNVIKKRYDKRYGN